MHTLYEARMLKAVEAVVKGLGVGALADRKKRAWALPPILAGGVTLARAVVDAQVSNGIVASIRSAALQAAQG